MSSCVTRWSPSAASAAPATRSAEHTTPRNPDGILHVDRRPSTRDSVECDRRDENVVPGQLQSYFIAIGRQFGELEVSELIADSRITETRGTPRENRERSLILGLRQASGDIMTSVFGADSVKLDLAIFCLETKIAQAGSFRSTCGR